MRRITSAVVVAVIGLASVGVASIHASNGRKPCQVKCVPCTRLVDLTPHNKNDCHFQCVPIEGCVPPA